VYFVGPSGRAILAVALWVGCAGAEVRPREAKNVIVLLSDNLSLPVVAQAWYAIHAHLKAPDPSAVNVYLESLDVSRFGNADYPSQVARWYRQKYHSIRPDVIVTVTVPALRFMLNQRNDLWPGIPIVAGAVTSDQIGSISLPADVTPVFMNLPYERTLEAALSLFPQTRRVVALSGSSPRDQADLPQLRELEAKTRHRLQWSYLTGLSADEFKSRLGRLPDQTIVLWSIVTTDSTGRSFFPASQAGIALAPFSSAPVFGVYPTLLGAGSVGGVMMDPAVTGRDIAETARGVIGLPPSSPLPLAKAGMGPPTFDWKQLQRWGVAARRLPPGSNVLFRPPSLLETHREVVIAVAIALLILTALVAFLSQERRRLAASQAHLRGLADALRHLSGALMMAQEAERARIARELHDDISQRLVLLSIETRQLLQQGGAAALVPRLEALSLAVDGISNDIRALAHGLHPAKLDLLGLLPAVKRHCQEVERQSGITVELTGGDLPDNLSRDTSLCLYRVIQESLANVVRHSGSKRASVDLRAADGAVALTIADDGRGFDPAIVALNHGMGLVSMRERLRLVDGAMSIQSRPDAGTEIKARVPAKVGQP